MFQDFLSKTFKSRLRHHFRYIHHHHHHHFPDKPSENPIKGNSSLPLHYAGDLSNYRHSLRSHSGPLRNSVGILTLTVSTSVWFQNLYPTSTGLPCHNLNQNGASLSCSPAASPISNPFQRPHSVQFPDFSHLCAFLLLISGIPSYQA